MIAVLCGNTHALRGQVRLSLVLGGGSQHVDPIVLHDCSKFGHLANVAGILAVLLADHSEDLVLGLTVVFVETDGLAILQEPGNQKANVATVGRGLAQGLWISRSVIGKPSLKLGYNKYRRMQNFNSCMRS